jgi:putative ABC transport system ATP-binding protein
MENTGSAKGESLLIETKQLWKTYTMGSETIHALQDITIKIEKGEFMSVMGPSGSGKSTLMNILGCLDSPSRGEYRLNGKSVSEMDDNALAYIRNQEVGFVFQVFNLLPRTTALHNVEMPLIYSHVPAGERLERARKVLDIVDLKDRVDHRPSELSGGERQRVAIARALINNPSIILADEPTGNLDSRTSSEIMELLNRLHGNGNTIILVTHEDEIASYSRRIVRLLDGKIESDERTG